jgi:Ca2+/H+ antiporter, TMEM165/GDT1 family
LHPSVEAALDALLLSIGLVSLAEIGDKTMLLAIALAATWCRPTPIVLGILAATLLNHAFAALAGTLAAQYLDGPWMRWIVGIAFLGFAVWALIPDTLDVQDEPAVEKTFSGVFWTTTAAFFLVEMGDKTQIATAGLAIRFENLPLVVLGSTLGMMLVNGPAVVLGEATAKRLPLKYIRMAAAAAFAATGLWVLVR